MFTGKNEFKEQVLFSIVNDEVILTDCDIENDIAMYKGYSDKTEIKLYCSYEDDRDFKFSDTISNLLNADYVKIYFDKECVLWVE